MGLVGKEKKNEDEEGKKLDAEELRLINIIKEH